MSPRAFANGIAITLFTLLGVLGLTMTVGCGGGTATKQEPAKQSATYKMRMANSLMSAGRISDALATVEEAIDEEPNNAALHLFHGQVSLDGGMLERAEAAFRRALELDAYMTDAYIYLGAVYQDMGQSKEAEEAYQAALTNPAYPTPEKAYLGLGILYLGQNRDPEAETNLRRAVGINPKYYAAHSKLADLLERTGKLEEAAREYEVAEPGFRQDGEYWYRRGLNYYRLNDYHRATDCLLRVRNVAPGSEAAARADELLDVME
jgi:tetratricopeptide (TPR) repeat protein